MGVIYVPLPSFSEEDKLEREQVEVSDLFAAMKHVTAGKWQDSMTFEAQLRWVMLL